MSDTIFETEVPKSQPKGQVGHLANAHDAVEEYIDNPEPQQRKEVSITVDTALDATEYSFDVVGGTVAYTTGTGATKEDVADGLINELETSPLIRGEVDAIKDSTDTLRVVGLEPGQDFSFSESDSNLSSSVVQSAQTANATGIGLAVLEDGTEASATGLTPQIRVYEHPGSSAGITLKAERQIERFTGASASDVASAISGHPHFGDILRAYNPSGSQLVIEVKVAGDKFEVLDADEMDALLDAERGDRIEEVLAGVSLAKYNISEDAEVFDYDGTRGVNVLLEGEIFVRNGENASSGDAAYIYLSGSNQSEFAASRTAGETVWIDPEYIEWNDSQELKVRLF
jgi:hypothetical protein